jgi:uroporphyrinogen decarboxylase
MMNMTYKRRADDCRLLRVFDGETLSPAPVWMMRQAGRYLPEYREVRKQAGDFLDLCYSPDFATEVTLQPIDRYGFDAAILFADILLIPDGLGQNVRFGENVGPILEPIRNNQDFGKLTIDNLHNHLAPVYQTVKQVRAALPKETALIGFCGAPWTVATYMISGRGTPDQKDARLAAFRREGWVQNLIDLLVESSVQYLCKQVENGADLLQIFDTWGGNLGEIEFEQWCIKPMAAIVTGVKQIYPDVPIIGFPRNAGVRYQPYIEQTGVNGVSLDTSISLQWAHDNLDEACVLQGNLDPLAVVAGGNRLEIEVRHVLDIMADRPFIFNLGHGLIPETPPENVGRVVEIIRSGV